MGNRNRLTTFLLTAVMILTMPQMQIAAAEVESPAGAGLCYVQFTLNESLTDS